MNATVSMCCVLRQ